MKGIVAFTLLCLVSSGCLALVHHFTKETRKENREEFENRELEGLVPSLSNSELCLQGLELYRVEERGYGGKIKLAVVYENSTLSGVRALSHTETPGFADILNPESWISNFGQMPLDHIDAVTRATITSKAVIKAIQKVNADHASGISPCN
ncbi:MAG: FMN-binding protein [Gammaproteobacteria bacterium]|nr:FMN-binding protein [Gammaproteobacteria bacterium]